MARWSGPASRPEAMAVADARTAVDVLGIARTTGDAPRQRSMASHGTPAATETMRWRAVVKGPISLNTAGMSCGFTARMITSLSAMSSALSRVVRTAKARASRARRLSLLLLVTVHCVGRSTPAAKTPRKSASAMFPAPMKPIVRSTCMAAPPTHDDAPLTQRAKGALPRYHLCSPAPKAGALTLPRATRPPFRGARRSGAAQGMGSGAPAAVLAAFGTALLTQGRRLTVPVEAFVVPTIALPSGVVNDRLSRVNLCSWRRPWTNERAGGEKRRAAIIANRVRPRQEFFLCDTPGGGNTDRRGAFREGNLWACETGS